jgi:hypothetical protein
MKYSRTKPFYKARETLALLMILALGQRQIEEGKTIPHAEVFRRLRARRGRRNADAN